MLLDYCVAFICKHCGGELLSVSSAIAGIQSCFIDTLVSGKNISPGLVACMNRVSKLYKIILFALTRVYTYMIIYIHI